jgi:HD superfamily phosphohydrolase YqeK
MGEHYVRLEDYAIEIKQKFGFDYDIEKIASATAIYDDRDKRYHMMKAEKVIEELKAAGFEDAAKFLEAKLD